MRQIFHYFLIGLLVFGALAVTGVNKALAQSYDSRQVVSLISLLARPRSYVAKEIEVSGFVLETDGGYALYLSKDDALYGVTKNAVFLKFDQNDLPDLDFDQAYCTVSGVFRLAKGEAEQDFSGTIDKILELAVLYKEPLISEAFRERPLKAIIKPTPF